AEQVEHVKRGVKLVAEDAIDLVVDVFERSQGVVGIALDEWQIEERIALGFQEDIIAMKYLLALELRLAGLRIGLWHSEEILLGDLFIVERPFRHVDLQAG